MMDGISIVVSAIGALLALFAVYRANTAYEMAMIVVARKKDRDDSQRLRDLISILVKAKDTAKRRESAGVAKRYQGRTLEQVLSHLRDAQDALHTKLPISWNDDQRSGAIVAASEIESALNTITAGGSNPSGWGDARTTIQTIIPRLEQDQRRLDDKSLIPLST